MTISLYSYSFFDFTVFWILFHTVCLSSCHRRDWALGSAKELAYCAPSCSGWGLTMKMIPQPMQRTAPFLLASIRLVAQALLQVRHTKQLQSGQRYEFQLGRYGLRRQRRQGKQCYRSTSTAAVAAAASTTAAATATHPTDPRCRTRSQEGHLRAATRAVCVSSGAVVIGATYCHSRL